ncbi:MAG: hypothetical protein U0599_04065 [Vicinamibacteria bacterium]
MAAVLHHLEVEAVAAEDLGEEPHALQRRGVGSGEDVLGDLAGQAAREAHQALGVLREEVLSIRGRVVEAVEVARGDELHEVVVAGVVRGEGA